MEEIDERVNEFFIELLELGAKSPELLEAYKKVLKEWLKIKSP